MISLDKKFSKLCIAAFLFLLCLTLYKNSLRVGFFNDAKRVIVENPLIKQPALYKRIFTEDLFSVHKKNIKSYLNYYRPITLLTFAVDYRLWRLDPFGYQLTNLILHALNGLLIYIFLLKLFKNRELALLSSVIFCILPVHEWVVSYTVGRCDLLQTFFTLFSLIFLIQSFETARRSKFILSILFFILAFLSRELALLHPVTVFIVCYFYFGQKGKALRYSLIFLAVAFIYGVFRFSFLPLISDAGLMQSPFSFRGIVIWFAFSVGYIMRFAFPWVVQAGVNPLTKLGLVKLVLSGCAIAVFVIYSWREFTGRKKGYLLFGWSWILTGCLPFFFMGSQFRELGPVLSEHYLYLSGVGFAVFLSGAILNARPYFQKIFFATVVLYYCLIAVYNNSYWRDTEGLLRHVRDLQGEVFSMVSEQLMDRDRANVPKIRQMISETVSPRRKSAWFRVLGNCYLKNKEYPGAIESFKEAIRLFPYGDVQVYFDLASAYSKTGNEDLSIECLREALTVEPESNRAHFDLGKIYYGRKDYKAAVPYLRQAVFYNPDHVDGLLYLGMSYFGDNQRDAAMSYLKKAMALSVNDSFAHRFIAAELYNKKYSVDAVIILQQAVRLFPRDTETWSLLAKIYSNLNDTRKAVEAWGHVLRLDPGNTDAKGYLEKIRKETTAAGPVR